MFLGVEWAKRWLPAVFLLLSMFLPWWMWVHHTPHGSQLGLSFPWNEKVESNLYFPPDRWMSFWMFDFPYHRLPVSCFVSALIFVSGLFGLSVRNKIRTLAGLLGIAGIISYFALIFPESLPWRKYASYPLFRHIHGFPYFGSALTETLVLTWFLSVGFYFALAGSLMLLSPIVRTSIGRIKKRLSSPEQTNEEPI